MSKSWGIIGGGFGLYGYLPAISQKMNCEVIVLKKNFKTITNRVELKKYIGAIGLVESYAELVQRSNSLVISTPPQMQEKYIALICSKKSKYENLILEKPLASNPIAAKKLLTLSIEKAESVRIGYSFIETEWAKSILESFNLNKNKEIYIGWEFYAHHFKYHIDSWKAIHNMGGGVLRFYGIQIIALLIYINEAVFLVDSTIFYSQQDRPYRWIAKFQFKNGVIIDININSKSRDEKFVISSHINNIVLKSPFDNQGSNALDDSRVPILKKLIDTNSKENKKIYKYYSDVNDLWLKVESNTVWKYLGE